MQINCEACKFKANLVFNDFPEKINFCPSCGFDFRMVFNNCCRCGGIFEFVPTSQDIPGKKSTQCHKCMSCDMMDTDEAMDARMEESLNQERNARKFVRD